MYARNAATTTADNVVPSPCARTNAASHTSAGTRTALTVTVHGTVAGQGSKRHVGRGVLIESSKRVKPWREAVRAAAAHAIEEWEAEHVDDPAGQQRFWQPYAGPVRVNVKLTFTRPRSHFRSGRFSDVLRPDAPVFKASPPDLDKALRATFDALTDAGVWCDDSRVAAVLASKVYGDRPGAVITITPIRDETS